MRYFERRALRRIFGRYYGAMVFDSQQPPALPEGFLDNDGEDSPSLTGSSLSDSDSDRQLLSSDASHSHSHCTRVAHQTQQTSHSESDVDSNGSQHDNSSGSADTDERHRDAVTKKNTKQNRESSPDSIISPADAQQKNVRRKASVAGVNRRRRSSAPAGFISESDLDELRNKPRKSLQGAAAPSGTKLSKPKSKASLDVVGGSRIRAFSFGDNPVVITAASPLPSDNSSHQIHRPRSKSEGMSGSTRLQTPMMQPSKLMAQPSKLMTPQPSKLMTPQPSSSLSPQPTLNASALFGSSASPPTETHQPRPAASNIRAPASGMRPSLSALPPGQTQGPPTARRPSAAQALVARKQSMAAQPNESRTKANIQRRPSTARSVSPKMGPSDGFKSPSRDLVNPTAPHLTNQKLETKPSMIKPKAQRSKSLSGSKANIKPRPSLIRPTSPSKTKAELSPRLAQSSGFESPIPSQNNVMSRPNVSPRPSITRPLNPQASRTQNFKPNGPSASRTAANVSPKGSFATSVGRRTSRMQAPRRSQVVLPRTARSRSLPVKSNVTPKASRIMGPQSSKTKAVTRDPSVHGPRFQHSPSVSAVRRRSSVMPPALRNHASRQSLQSHPSRLQNISKNAGSKVSTVTSGTKSVLSSHPSQTMHPRKQPGFSSSAHGPLPRAQHRSPQAKFSSATAVGAQADKISRRPSLSPTHRVSATAQRPSNRVSMTAQSLSNRVSMTAHSPSNRVSMTAHSPSNRVSMTAHSPSNRVSMTSQGPRRVTSSSPPPRASTSKQPSPKGSQVLGHSRPRSRPSTAPSPSRKPHAVKGFSFDIGKLPTLALADKGVIVDKGHMPHVMRVHSSITSTPSVTHKVPLGSHRVSGSDATSLPPHAPVSVKQSNRVVAGNAVATSGKRSAVNLSQNNWRVNSATRDLDVARVPMDGVQIHRLPINTGVPMHTVPIQGVPYARIPMHRVPNARIPMHRVPNARIPMHRVPNARIPIHRVPIHRLPMGTVPMHRVPTFRFPMPRVPKHGVQKHRMAMHRLPLYGVPLHRVPSLRFSMHSV
jgi:hypothetical protein